MVTTTKRYIVTIPVNNKNGVGWGNVQIGEVVKSVPALKKVIAQAKPLSKHGVYSVWTMTYRLTKYKAEKVLKEDHYSHSGHLIDSRDRTDEIYIRPRRVPEFPSYEEIGWM